jgi:hypothetical protein
MKLTTKQIINSVDSLNKLIGERLPAKASFRIAQVSRQLDDHLKDYQKTLTKLHQEFGKKNDDGELVRDARGVIQFDDFKTFSKEHEDLLGCEVEVNGKSLKLDLLTSVNLEPSIFYHLDWFVKE